MSLIAKSLAAKAANIKAVKTINGSTPDASGNIIVASGDLTSILVPGKNLYDKTKATDKMIVNITATTGNQFAHATHSVSDWIVVDAGQSYVFNVPCNYGFYNASKAYIVGSGSNSLIEETPVLAPTGALYLRFSIDTAMAGIKDACQVEKNTVVTTYSPFGSKITRSYIEPPDIINPYADLKWNVLGDSLTAYARYQLFVKNKLKIGTVRTYGFPGSNIRSGTYSFVERYPTMDNDADIITVLGGTNDWGNNTIIDNPANKYDATTIIGAIRTIIEGMIIKYPGKYIIWGTPTHRDNESHPTGVNANGDSMSDVANAIKKVCRDYSIPCIDFYSEVGINKFNMNTNGSLMPDRIHPADAGYKRMAALYIDMFKKIIY